MHKKNVTVKDLAKICGVSIGTVDRAINNRKGINEETKKRILQAADEYGFIKNQNALTLSSGHSNNIGVIIFNLKSEYFSTLITSIEEEARRNGYNLVIMMSNYDPETEIERAKSMVAMHVAGLIVFSVLQDKTFYSNIQKKGTPVIAVGNRIGDGIPFVGIDDMLAMRASCEYVLSQGYQRLLYIAPLLEKGKKQNISAQSLRYKGFLDVVRNTPNIVWKAVDTYTEYNEHLLDYIDPSVPTALICPSDSYTLHCLALFRERKNIGIMGFDRFLTLEQLLPDLSGITYSSEAIGIAATQSILNSAQEDIIIPFKISRGETV